jgi:hypothetical protein
LVYGTHVLTYLELAHSWRIRTRSSLAWRGHRSSHVQHPRALATTPLAALIGALQRLRWHWTSPHVFTKAAGNHSDLFAGSPAMLKHYVACDLRASLDTEADRWLGTRPGALATSPTHVCSQLRHLLRRARLSGSCALGLVATLAGTATTPAWLALHGWDAPPTRPSRAEPAEVFHALFGRGPPDDDAASSRELVRVLWSEPPISPSANVPFPEVHCAINGRTVPRAHFSLVAGAGPVYADGSACNALIPGLRQVRAAAVQGPPVRGWRVCQLSVP